MEIKKDIKDRYATIDRIFNGHALLVQPFKSNFSASHMYGRAERILAATYVLTKNVPDTDPARSIMRTRAYDLISTITQWFQEKGDGKIAHVRQLLLIERELASLIRVLSIGGYVSDTNLSLFLQALTDLGAYAERHVHDETDDGTGAIVSEQDFIPTSEVLVPPRGSVAKYSSKRVATVVSAVSNGSQLQGTEGIDLAQKKGDQGPRRQIIVDLLSQKGRLGIRDIALQIVGVSEKTVQRELAQLVSDGTVTKEGKKRWSTYGLVI